jgi:hypothetical protein
MENTPNDTLNDVPTTPNDTQNTPKVVKKRVRNTQTVKEYNKKYQMLKKQEENDLKKQIKELEIELAYYKNQSIE